MVRRKRSRRNTKDTSGIIAGRSLGEAILNCLQAVLKRCQKTGMRLDYPGEGRERPFRHWLATDLIHEVLGWRIISPVSVDELFLLGRSAAPCGSIPARARPSSIYRLVRHDFSAGLDFGPFERPGEKC